MLNREEAGNLLIWNRVHCHEEEEGDANDNNLVGGPTPVDQIPRLDMS